MECRVSQTMPCKMSACYTQYIPGVVSLCVMPCGFEACITTLLEVKNPYSEHPNPH